MTHLEGVRSEFTAVFAEMGQRKEGRRTLPTLLLADVRLAEGQQHADTEALLADHLWLNDVEPFKKVHLRPGTHLIFFGRVRRYSRGHVNDIVKGLEKGETRGREQDFTIAQVEKVRVLKSARPDLEQYEKED